MITSDKRQSIYQLHLHGHSIRKISKLLRVSRTTVRRAIEEKGMPVEIVAGAEDQALNTLIEELYNRCSGRAQRVFEMLTNAGNTISYSSVTRRLRQMKLTPTKKRAERVQDEPGAEMQHDTTIYTVLIGEKKVKVVASLLYFRYSKMKYLKLYYNFDRFKMKCFFHEALQHYGCSAPICIIDNTNLARLRGSGSSAIITDEMTQFAKRYGFQFICHQINHPNRKAGNERSFWTVETNFLPGRTFSSLEDLNTQAFKWATEINANRPVSRTKLIPASAFEHEKHFLTPVSEHIEPPYRQHERVVDQYGYIAFCVNYYWIPECHTRQVTVLEYADKIKIYENHHLLIEYPLPDSPWIKNKFFKSNTESQSQKPRNFKRKKPIEEERQLRALDSKVDAYLTWVLKQESIHQRAKLIRQLFQLSRQLETSIFINTIERAHRYGITDRASLEKIGLMLLKDSGLPMMEIPTCFDYEKRTTYQLGRVSCAVDLSRYSQDSKKD